MLGIGGGGDVVGALAAVRLCEALGTPARLGGVAWERLPIDPRPGPRSTKEIIGGRRLGEHAVLADGETTTIDGIPFSESHVAAHLGEEMVLVDIGGDAIAAGTEPGLASPLCDSVMLAAGLRLRALIPHEFMVLGSGCDGELEPEEVLARVGTLAAIGAWSGTWSVTAPIADEIEAAAVLTGTEASLQVVRCARGEVGEAEIRGGRRTVPLSPLGALGFCFAAERSRPGLPMANAVLDSTTLEAAHDSLMGKGIRTELAYERERAAG